MGLVHHARFLSACLLRFSFAHHLTFCPTKLHLFPLQAVDLVSYVEFQKNYRSLLEYHKAALEATRDFWRLVMRETVPVRRAYVVGLNGCLLETACYSNCCLCNKGRLCLKLNCTTVTLALHASY